MLRKRALALAISLLFPAVAPALGLGALKAASALNQPFEGKIEIIGAQPTDFDTLTIKLADQTQFERAGLLRSSVLLSLRFEVVTNAKGNDYIRVYSQESVREPYLDFLLELNWGEGKMVREYTVLLDPPMYDPNRRAAPVAVRPAPRPLTNPTAAPRATQGPAVAPSQPASPAPGSDLGAVKTGDTLWKLAQRSKPAAVTVQQMMIALLRANPAAFPTANINVLRQGAVLRMPTAEELAALSRSEANVELARQNQLWQEYRQSGSSRVAAQQPRTSGEAQATPASPEAAKPDARLEIVTPAAKAGEQAAPGAAPADGALRQEKVATDSAETRDLKARLDEAEDIIDLLQRQVQLKDDELARLQASQAGTPLPAAPATGPATAAAEPAPVAPATESPAGATDAPVTESTESPAPPADSTSPAPVAETAPAPPAAGAPATTPQAQVPPAPTEDAGPLDGLVPPALRDLVPGGAVTVLGIFASLLALVGLGVARLRGRKPQKPAAATAVSAIATVVAAAPPGLVDEDIQAAAKTVVPDLRDLSETHPREDVRDRFGKTIEASAESLVTDPLEEVNVYLAYERFDQAEELVRKVIAESPQDPRFRLRLLEIFYSAGNLAAYETAARDFLSLVGEDDPSWQSAVAMWNAMSPKRPLFSGAAPAAAATVAASTLVDISAPSDADAIESTQVGLHANASVDSGPPLDETSDPTMSGMIDLTAGEEPEEILDLTATVEKLTLAGYLAPGSEETPSDHEVVDLTGGAGDMSRLLDLNSTGDVFEPGLAATDTVPGEGLANTASGGGLASAFAPEPEAEVDFDIGDLGDFNMDATSAPLDLGPLSADSDAIDFDLEGLGEGELLFEATSEVKDVVPAAQTGTSELIAEDFGLDLDLLGAEDAVAETTSEQLLEDRSMSLARAEPDLDFDLSLDETGEIEPEGGTDTHGMGTASLDESALENLSAELEASLAALGDQADAPDGDEFSLDLSSPDFNQINADDLEIDFDLEGPDQSLVDLDITADVSQGPGAAGYAVPGQSAFDEVDSKLDLAKAYLELGEHEAARSILAEAAKEGSIAQQEEAGRLLAQIG